MLHTHRITKPFSGPHGPLLSPWPGHRRVMANALRIKCILSLTARWHRCLDASAISRLRYSLSLLVLPLRFGWILPRFIANLPFSKNEGIFRDASAVATKTQLHPFRIKRNNFIEKLIEIDNGQLRSRVYRYLEVPFAHEAPHCQYLCYNIDEKLLILLNNIR